MFGMYNQWIMHNKCCSTNLSTALPISADNWPRNIEHVLFRREKSANTTDRSRLMSVDTIGRQSLPKKSPFVSHDFRSRFLWLKLEFTSKIWFIVNFLEPVKSKIGKYLRVEWILFLAYTLFKMYKCSVILIEDCSSSCSRVGRLTYALFIIIIIVIIIIMNDNLYITVYVLIILIKWLFISANVRVGFCYTGFCARTNTKIYYNVDKDSTPMCFRRFNATHQIGCSCELSRLLFIQCSNLA